MAPSHGSCPKAWSQIQCSFYFLGLSCKEPLRLLFQILHFNRRKIWSLKVYIDWKRCAIRKHIKPGVRFQYSHTAEGNMVSIRALSVRLGGVQMSELCQAASRQPWFTPEQCWSPDSGTLSSCSSPAGKHPTGLERRCICSHQLKT